MTSDARVAECGIPNTDQLDLKNALESQQMSEIHCFKGPGCQIYRNKSPCKCVYIRVYKYIHVYKYIQGVQESELSFRLKIEQWW